MQANQSTNQLNIVIERSSYDMKFNLLVDYILSTQFSLSLSLSLSLPLSLQV